MDSGIESTESSCGSLNDGGSDETAFVNLNCKYSLRSLFNNTNQQKKSLQPCTSETDDQDCENVRLERYKLQEDSCPSMRTSSLETNQQSTYDIAKDVKENMTINEDNHDSPDSQKSMPPFTIPEGSSLQFHFPPIPNPVVKKVIDDLYSHYEPVCGLTCENVSPIGYGGGGTDAYAHGYVVSSYKNHDLKRKFKHYRSKLHQISLINKEKRLRTAASLNNVESVETLLRNGSNPKATDERQRTPLHIAAAKGYSQVIKLLLEYGADPNQIDAVGNTPLHLAACTAHIETVTQLIKAGTNLKQVDNQGYSPLHLAKISSASSSERFQLIFARFEETSLPDN